MNLQMKSCRKKALNFVQTVLSLQIKDANWRDLDDDMKTIINLQIDA